MYEQSITISAEKYDELVRKAERIEVVRRMLASERYTSTDDVEVILDIKEKEGSEDEVV